MTAKSVARFDRGTVRGQAVVTDEGFIRANAVVTRVGVFRYQNSDGTVRLELRHPEDVMRPESLESMKMIPVTNGHPPERLVTAENAKKLSIGYTGETINEEAGYLLSKVVITDKSSVDDVVGGKRKELSLGYTVDLVPEEGIYNGEPYQFRQTNIKYNHLSIVDTARAGGEARIALDSQDAVQIDEQEESKMARVKVKFDGEELEMEKDQAEHFEKLLEDLRNLQDEKDRVEREMDIVKKALEKAEGERDSMEDKLKGMDKEGSEAGSAEEQEAKMDAMVKERVRGRVKLEKVAESVLDKETLSKLDSMSDLEIKKSVIQSKSKLNLDGKGETYIDAAFDIAIQGLSKAEAKAVPKGKMSHSDASEPNANEARSRMVARMTNPKGGK